MAVINCICGNRIEAEGSGALFTAIRAHWDGAHADRAASDEDVRDLVRRHGAMPDWDGSTVRLASAPVVRPLDQANGGDFLHFFENVGFIDNPAWSDCYCMFPHYAGDAWEGNTAEQNRADRIALIDRGEAFGHIAYIDGEPAGWCNAGPREAYPWITKNAELTGDDVGGVGSIICFVVGPRYRRQGVGTALLDAACAEFARRGLRIAEAYPALTTMSDARAYHGPIEMYEAAGFTRHHEHNSQIVVRKPLI